MKFRNLLLASAVACITTAASAYADVGDISNTLYNTDIITYLDDIPIRSFSLDGQMMICVEDLRDYGYTVTYDDSIRSLFANKTDDPASDFHPQIEVGTVGGIAGYTYETDITVYINGIPAYAENIGGRMAVIAEEIADTKQAHTCSQYNPYNRYEAYGASVYGLAHNYNDTERALYIYNVTDKLPSYQEQLSRFLNGNDFFYSDSPQTTKPEILDRKDTKDCTLLLYSWSNVTSLATFYKNGVSMDMYNILMQYHFIEQMHTTIDSGYFSEKGEKCYINARRYKRNGIMSYALIDEGFYEIDTKSFVITQAQMNPAS